MTSKIHSTNSLINLFKKNALRCFTILSDISLNITQTFILYSFYIRNCSIALNYFSRGLGMKKENRSNNIDAKHLKLDKHQCYELAKSFWEKGDAKRAEEWALNAMRIGSKNLAPQLLADIARSTRSKSTAITLASFYWSHKDTVKVLYWNQRRIRRLCERSNVSPR